MNLIMGYTTYSTHSASQTHERKICEWGDGRRLCEIRRGKFPIFGKKLRNILLFLYYVHLGNHIMGPLHHKEEDGLLLRHQVSLQLWAQGEETGCDVYQKSPTLSSKQVFMISSLSLIFVVVPPTLQDRQTHTPTQTRNQRRERERE